MASLFICTKGRSLVRVHAHRLAALRAVGTGSSTYSLSSNINNAAKSLSINTDHDIVVNADLDLLWLLQPALLNVGGDDTILGRRARDDWHERHRSAQRRRSPPATEVSTGDELALRPSCRRSGRRDLLVVWWKERPLSPQQQLRHPGPDAA